MQCTVLDDNDYSVISFIVLILLNLTVSLNSFDKNGSVDRQSFGGLCWFSCQYCDCLLPPKHPPPPLHTHNTTVKSLNPAAMKYVARDC